MALVSLKFMDPDVYMWKKLSLAKGQKGIRKFEVLMISTVKLSDKEQLDSEQSDNNESLPMTNLPVSFINREQHGVKVWIL
jgi:hypothetical protein